MGQHRHHTTRSTPQIPTWPPAHSPLPTGEIRGYNIAYGMLVKTIRIFFAFICGKLAAIYTADKLW